MEPWQRLGVYAAGLALDSAGVKEDAAFKSALQLIVAAGGGERDVAVDGAILTGLREAADPGAFLNERLLNDLRPTLFLAQLSNLLAGNISIVHGVTGASRTFMGEESAGVDALRIGHARIASGQVETMMVGGSYSAERPDVMVIHEMGGFLLKPAYRPVLERGDEGGGFILGSAAAFLVLEAAEHAAARGARALARLLPVANDRVARAPGSVTASLTRLFGEAGVERPDVVLSGSTGLSDLGREEVAGIQARLPGTGIRATGDMIGHPMEVAAPFGAALAAALCAAGSTGEVAVTSVGHRRGEGVIRVVKA